MKPSVPVLAMAGAHGLQFDLQTMRFIYEERQTRIEHPHKHDYFVVIWIRKGEGVHMVDFEQFAVEDQQLFFLTPGQVHQLAASPETDGIVISFHHDFFCLTEQHRELLLQSGLFFNCSQFHPVKLNAGQASQVEELIAMMQRELVQPLFKQAESLRSLLQLFLISGARFWGNSNREVSAVSRPAWLTRAFLSLLESDFKIKSKVSEYAEALVVSPNHLNETVKAVTGFPVSDHIKKRIILEAKRMVLMENATAKEIAGALGFDDEAHFSKYFKQNAGLRFIDFKQQQQEAAPHLPKNSQSGSPL